MGKISFAALRAKCAELGITPGRSVEETQRRLDQAEVTRRLNDTSHGAAELSTVTYDEIAGIPVELWAAVNPRMSRTMRKLADYPMTPVAVLLGR